jgi:hypothetical protein
MDCLSFVRCVVRTGGVRSQTMSWSELREPKPLQLWEPAPRNRAA